MNVTTEKIAKHTGLPENLIDDACEMNYNYKHSTSSNIFGHSNRMEEKELQEYEDILKHYRDLRNSLYTAEEKGHAQGHTEGLAQGRAEGLAQGHTEGLTQGRAEGINEGIMLISKNLKTMGLSVADIIKATGLSEDDIAKL